jgi:hypothetical protein
MEEVCSRGIAPGYLEWQRGKSETFRTSGGRAAEASTLNNKPMNDFCFACKSSRRLTVEHIIPQALGGRLKARLYCTRCNQTFGHTLDHEISNQFGAIGTLLKIKRERGKAQPYEVKDLSSGTMLVLGETGLERKRPIVKVESLDGTKLDFADITARSQEELERICTSIENKYKLSRKIEMFQETMPGPLNLIHETTLDNKLLRRAVSKIAYGFLCTKIPRFKVFSSDLEAIRAYVMDGKDLDLACANFVNTRFMTDYARPLHKIHIALNRDEQILVGYVSLFGIFRFTVLLSDGIASCVEWPGLDYTFDPVLLREICGNDRFRAPHVTRGDILHPKQSRALVLDELKKGHKVIESYVENYRFLAGT